MENKEIEQNNIGINQPALKTKKKLSQIILKPEDENSVVELTEKAKKALFDFLKELEISKEGNINLEKLKELKAQIITLKENHKDEQEYQKMLDEYLNTMKTKLSAFIKVAPSNINDEKLKELLNILFPNIVPISVDLSGIDIKKITELYNKLHDAIESGNLKQETIARGRLIKILKKEQNNINSSFKDIEVLEKIGIELSKENISLENIKKILEEKENKNLYLYFKDYFNDTKALCDVYKKLLEDEDIQRLFFLSNALSEQLKEHRENLDKRFSSEFLEKRSRLTSIFTELPNAIGLSIKKLNNSINELSAAKTQRRKLASIKQIAKDSAKVVSTPVLFTGKYVMSNWYTFYMAYQGIAQAKAQGEKENQAQTKTEESTKNKNETKVNSQTEVKPNEQNKDKPITQHKKNLDSNPKAKFNLYEEENIQNNAENEVENNTNTRPIINDYEVTRPKPNTPPKASPSSQTNVKPSLYEDPNETPNEAPAHNVAPVPNEATKTEPSNEPVEPTPPDNYDNLKGTRMISIMPPTLLYEGSIYDQLRHGIITPDTKVQVTYVPENTPWWIAMWPWGHKTINIPLKDVQTIFNWDVGVNYEEIYNSYGMDILNKGKGR